MDIPVVTICLSFFDNLDQPPNWLCSNLFGAIMDPNSPLYVIVSFISSLLGILSFIAPLLLALMGIRRYRAIKAFRNFLRLNYSEEDRKTLKRYYIPTRAQDTDPCEKDEIGESGDTCQTQYLIDYFIKEALSPKCRDKYYLILADSGMGKTTFLLKLFRTLSWQRQGRVSMVPLAQESCLEQIRAIEDQEDTVLLLDALDENTAAINQYDTFFSDLLRTTERFRKVVITCRTQFFPDRASEPTRSGRIQTGTGNKKQEIVRKYIAPLNDQEIKKYLRNKYRFNNKKRKQALAIISKIPALMARPIILNWIDFLCTEPNGFKYSYQIYRSIIDKWIQRENLENSEQRLMELSIAICRYMCDHKISSVPAEYVDNIARSKAIQLEPIIAKSRSLLNRNGDGNYKFAHRSFLEYFTALDHFQTAELPGDTSYFFSMNGYKRFLFEMLLECAENTDPDSHRKCTQLFSLLHSQLTNTNTELLDGLVHWNALKIQHRNTLLGSQIVARFSYHSCEEKEGKHILIIKDNDFQHYALPPADNRRSPTFLAVTFNTEKYREHLCTTVTLNGYATLPTADSIPVLT